MRGPSFVKISNSTFLSNAKKYSPPEMATHVGVFKGQIAFFACLSEEFIGQGYRGSRWYFFAIPVNMAAVSFPDYRYKDGPGYFYGEPRWWPFLDDEFRQDMAGRMVVA